MNISTSLDKSIAFEAEQTTIKDRNQKQLEEESAAFEQVLAQTNGISSTEMSYKSTNLDEDKTLTTFKDPINGKDVSVALDNKTIERLKKHFGDDDVYTSKNGIVKLDNKAEAYVSGWFADIAYNRNFIGADEDKDGKISKSEYENTKNNFEAQITIGVNKENNKEVSVSETIGKSYINSINNDEFVGLYRSHNAAKSLDDELNTTINIDKDFNSKVDIQEAYSADSKMTKEELLLAHVNSISIEDIVKSNFSKEQQEEKLSDLEKLKAYFNDILSLAVAFLLDEDEGKMKDIMQRLKESKGDISVLSEVEKALVKNLTKMDLQENGKYLMDDITKVLDLFNNNILNRSEEDRKDNKKTNDEEKFQISSDKTSKQV